MNYFNTTFRSLSRNKRYTFLNWAGLAVGIGACLLIFLFVQFELSFDNFHPDRGRVYRVVSIPYQSGSPLGMGPGAPLPVAKTLRIEFPQLEKVASIFGRDGLVTIRESGKKFNEEGGVYFAEPEFFDVFNFGWLSGVPRTALAAPNSVVLRKETAVRYFGDWKTAVGRSIKFNNTGVYQVTGILQDVPANTDFPLKVVFSYTSLNNVDLTDWQGIYTRGYTFVRLPGGLVASQMNRQLRGVVDRHTPAGRERRGIELQPLNEMHFDGRFGNFSGRTFSRELLTSLSLMAAFLLVIACVNFVNLATAQAVKRSKEVGIRKVLGSSRGRLILQFLGETGVITILAVAGAFFLASMALPFLNDLLQTHLVLTFDDPFVLGFLSLIAVVAALMAGLYPAFFLSRFNPSTTLKHTPASSGLNLRRGLVVLQFCIAQVLIFCVLVISGQIDYFRHSPLGFDKTSIVNVPIPNDSVSQSKMETVRQELLRVPGIRSVSFSTFSPLDNDLWSNQFKFDHATTKTQFQAFFKWADADFFKTYQPVLVAGRLYGPGDTLREFVVNETLVKKLGLREPKDILGKEISFWDQKRAPVVGVVKDFQTNSMQESIKPVIMGAWKETYALAGIKLDAGAVGQSLAAIERIWNAAYPDALYSYEFLDDKIDHYYKEEEKLAVLYKLFAGIAILISCLGLYGLVSFMAAERSREISIRKVLGASVIQVMLLLSREFTMLIGIAFLVAAPVGYHFMHHWLNGFAYRIELGAGLFLVCLVVSVLIAWSTVGYRAFRAAMANPAKALRSE